MTCASCGRRVATGARYCVHCGAEQSMPTPIAVAASMARQAAGAREAANAANAESTATVESIGLPGRVPSERARERTDANVARDAANSDQPGRPAYADAPSRRGLAIALVASLAVVAIAVGVFAVWRIEGADGNVAPDASSSAAAAAVPSAAAPPTAEGVNNASESATPATQPPAEPSEAIVSSQTAQANTATAPAVDATTPVEIRSLPPHPATSRTHVAQPGKPAAPMATTRPAEAPPAQADTATPAVTHAHVAAASTAATRVADRWQRLDEEIAQCTRADFITRVICGQRARFRYCNGYWGKVPQCPGSPATTDRGQ